MIKRQTRRQVCLTKCEIIDGETNKPFRDYNINRDRCECLICHDILNPLTHAHAELHGYRNKQEIIAAGMIKFIGRARVV